MGYRNIMAAVDNSDYSNHGVKIGIEIASAFEGAITGVHAYAAKLHDLRFRQMEGGLPERYRFEGELERQRDIHDSLITKGLEIITDSYLDAADALCKAANIVMARKSLEGKNYKVLSDDINSNQYDMVILGAMGLGAIKENLLGSVCERVVRRVNADLLIVKNTTKKLCSGKIMVGVDGSPESYGGLQIALLFAQRLGASVSVVSAYDPYFHYAAFNSIAKVLSEEAGKIFRFKQQEQIHEEIIDDGLAKIYKAHLEVAKGLAKDKGVDVKTALLAGKPYDAIMAEIRKEEPDLLILGKIGIHKDDGLDIGSNCEKLLRLAPCHVLVTSRRFVPPAEIVAEQTVAWTKEAEERMERVPTFVRNMAKMAILRFAQEKGHTVISSSMIDEAMGKFMPQGAMDSHGMGKCTHSSQKPAEDDRMTWEEDALEEIQKIGDDAVREQVRLRTEKRIKMKGLKIVKKDDVREGG